MSLKILAGPSSIIHRSLTPIMQFAASINLLTFNTLSHMMESIQILSS